MAFLITDAEDKKILPAVFISSAPGIAFILEYLTAPAFQFVLAKVNLAFNADTVLAVY